MNGNEKKSVLIVDDNEDAKGAYEIAFADSPFELTYLTSSLDALRYCNHHESDAVLVDLAMPDMDGIRLVKEIRKNEQGTGSHTRIAWFTARSIGEVEKSVQARYGVEIVFPKPIDPLSLITEIDRWLCSPQPAVPNPPREICDGQNGAVLPTMVTAIVGIVIIILLIAVFNNEIHKREEAAAYRFSDKRNELNQMTQMCNANWEKSAALHIWLGQQNIKPPPELLAQRVCAVSVKESGQ